MLETVETPYGPVGPVEFVERGPGGACSAAFRPAP